MMKEKTITVDGFLGTKEITKQRFIDEWSDMIGQQYYLSNNEDEFKKMKEYREFIEGLAGKKFDEIYRKQRG